MCSKLGTPWNLEVRVAALENDNLRPNFFSERTDGRTFWGQRFGEYCPKYSIWRVLESWWGDHDFFLIIRAKTPVFFVALRAKQQKWKRIFSRFARNENYVVFFRCASGNQRTETVFFSRFARSSNLTLVIVISSLETKTRREVGGRFVVSKPS